MKYRGRPERHSYCKECHRRNRLLYKDKRPWASRRDSYLWNVYRIRESDFLRMWEDQGGACEMCSQPFAEARDAQVDHNHSCCPGKKSCGRCIRGLLCWRCNKGIGCFNDDVALMKLGVSYIKKYQLRKAA